MSKEYDNYDNDLDSNQWSDEDNQEREEKQAKKDEEGEFIFFGIFSGFFDWLFK